jgi:hypothetical protein
MNENSNMVLSFEFELNSNRNLKNLITSTVNDDNQITIEGFKSQGCYTHKRSIK